MPSISSPTAEVAESANFKRGREDTHQENIGSDNVQMALTEFLYVPKQESRNPDISDRVLTQLSMQSRRAVGNSSKRVRVRT